MVTQRYREFLADPALVAFLKHEGAFEAFREALAKTLWGNSYADLDNGDQINSAFDWADTLEGHVFWAEVSKTYRRTWADYVHHSAASTWFLEEGV